MEPSWKTCGIALVLLIVPLAVAGGGTWEEGGAASASPRPVSTPDASTPDDAAAREEASARLRAFRGELERLLPLDRWRRADWGVLVTSLDQGDTIFDFNAHRPFIPASNVKLLTAAAALPHLGEGASIIGVTSVTAYRGQDLLIDYSSTKGAILSFVRALAHKLADRGIRVNGVAPGPIWTPLIPASFPPDKVKDFGKSSTLGRPGQPNEVSPSLRFLACEDSSFMTGHVLHPDGGAATVD